MKFSRGAMSRKIKFRAWSTYPNAESVVNGRMYYPTCLEFDKNGINGGGIWRGHPCTGGTGYNDILMQYTGLKDKNGVEAYENDIVRWNKKIWIMIFSTRLCGYYLQTLESFIDISGKNKLETVSHARAEHACEVIGNIYENPELLEAGNAQK